MKLAFSTLGCPDWSWDNISATAKDMGFDGVEIRGVGNEIYAPKMRIFSEANIPNVKARLERLGIEISCLTTGAFIYDETLGEAPIKECYEYMDLAEQIGVKYIRVLGDKNPEPSQNISDDYVISALKKLGVYASKRGVTVLIESNGVYADSKRLLKVMDAVGMDSVKVLWDIHHPVRYFGESPKETYKLIGKYVAYVHVKDSIVDENNAIKYKMMGKGTMPLDELFEVLKDNNYQGYVSLEWVKRWSRDLEEPGIAFMQFMSYMRKKR